VLAGIDTHKDTLALGIIDEAGRPVVVRNIPNTEIGFDTLEGLLADHEVTRVGIEGSGNYGRGIALRLVVAGMVEVVEVPPSLTSRERSGRPGQGKTDPVDAVAIASITAREPLLPPVRLAAGAAADACASGSAGWPSAVRPRRSNVRVDRGTQSPPSFRAGGGPLRKRIRVRRCTRSV